MAENKHIPDDEDICSWGQKYAGHTYGSIPASYLLFVWEKVQRTYANDDLMNYIEDNLTIIQKEASNVHN